MRLLAVDLGASSGRTIVGTVENGKIRLEETHRFVNGMQDIDGHKYWDVLNLVEEIKKGIAAAGSVDGIGIDTWGVDYGYLDADGELIGKPFAYRDSRNDAMPDKVYSIISKKDLYVRAGLQEMPFNTIFQLMADKTQRPEVFERASRMLFMPELISYLLTGEAVSEYTIASTSGLLDAKTRDWDWELIDMLGYPRRIFGEIKKPGAPAGSYNGIPVFLAPMHDTASAVAAVPAVEPGTWAFLSSGTWSLIGAELDEPVLTEASAEADFTNEGGVNDKIRFLKNVNGMWLINECRRIWEAEGSCLGFKEMDEAAEASTFAGIIDPNEPRFMAPDNMPAEIAAALKEAGEAAPQTQGDFAKCCYASLANAYKEQLTVMQDATGKTFERLHIVGGGTKAVILSRMTAKALGIPVITGPIEATALGNLCTLALAKGAFKDLTEMRQCIADSFPMESY